jgi:hypothetical protein
MPDTALESRRPEWQAWKEAMFGSEYMIWHDGLDTDAVARLKGEARARGLEMLGLGMALGDAHAAQALAACGDTSQLGEMRAQMALAQGSSRVKLALAIHRVAPEPALAAELVLVLQRHPWWGDRIDAAMGLRHFAGADDEAALLDSVSGDPEYLVRYHASDSLLVRWGVTPADVGGHKDIFPDICGPREGAPGPEDFARYAQAREKLLALRKR